MCYSSEDFSLGCCYSILFCTMNEGFPFNYSCIFASTEKIHWFSIFNSFMMVIFLVGLVSMILMRTLRKDYARYSKEEEMDDMVRSRKPHCMKALSNMMQKSLSDKISFRN